MDIYIYIYIHVDEHAHIREYGNAQHAEDPGKCLMNTCMSVCTNSTENFCVCICTSNVFNIYNSFTYDAPKRHAHIRIPHNAKLTRNPLQVDFIPLSTRTYDLQLVMDVEGVGEHMATVAIKANAIVPEVTISTTELDFGDCFLRHAYKKAIALVNHSDLPAKFELHPQDEISRCVAMYDVDHAVGTIEPFQERVITVSFTTERPEQVRFDTFVWLLLLRVLICVSEMAYFGTYV